MSIFVNTFSKCANHKCCQHMSFIVFVPDTLKYKWYNVIRTSVSFVIFLMLSGHPCWFVYCQEVWIAWVWAIKWSLFQWQTYIRAIYRCHSPPDVIAICSMRNYACTASCHFTWHYFHTYTVIIMNVALKHHKSLCHLWNYHNYKYINVDISSYHTLYELRYVHTNYIPWNTCVIH